MAQEALLLEYAEERADGCVFWAVGKLRDDVSRRRLTQLINRFHDLPLAAGELTEFGLGSHGASRCS